MEDDGARADSIDATPETDRDSVPMTERSHGISTDDICVLIPTLNEEATIEAVIDGFHEQGYTNVLVIDGNSTDATRELARGRDARVLTQSGSGKGQAVREALEYIDVPYVVMVDGDGTYDPVDIDQMVEPLEAGYDHVIGNRFAAIEEDAMTRLNRAGNWLINRSFRVIHGATYEDILSGYRAFTTASVRQLSLEADGFTIETELAVECVKHGLETAVVPVRYRARPDESETNLHPIADGGRIILTLYSLAKTNNPLFYFGSVGGSAIISGGVVASYVLIRWLWYGVSHEVLAVVAATGIILGVQLLMFGVLSDMIVTLHREQRSRLERIARESAPQPERTQDRQDREGDHERTQKPPNSSERE